MRCARADEYGIVALVQNTLQALHAGIEDLLHAHVENVANLLVEHFGGEAEGGNLRAHEAAGLGMFVVEVAFVAQRHQVARHRQRGRAAANQRHAAAILLLRDLREAILDFILVVGADALEATDRHRLVLHAAAAAGRFAGSVAGAAQNARKNIRLPVDHIGVGIAPSGNQPNIFRHRRMGRAGELAIDHFVEIFRVLHIGRFHTQSPVSCWAD